MAHQPIYGFAGRPVLNYAGTMPVCMSSPGTYANWYRWPGSTVVDCDVTSGDGYVRITTSNPMSDFYFTGYITLYMRHTSASLTTITGTLTTSGGSNFGGGVGYFFTYVEGDLIAHTESLFIGGTTSASLAIPYYRYKIFVYLQGSLSVQYGSGEWLQMSLSLS